VLIAASGKTFKEVADVIGISAAALSKKLGGETNLTLDSIVDISGAIEADFDIVFRPKSAHRTRQPWEAKATIDAITTLYSEIKVMHAHVAALNRTTADIARAQFRKGVASKIPTTVTYSSFRCANDGVNHPKALCGGGQG